MAKQPLDEFEIDGVSFKLGPLPVLVAERLAPALAALVTPAIAAMFAGKAVDVAQIGMALQGLTGSFEQLPKFREAFAAQCAVTLGEVAGKAVWTELKGNVLDQVFGRKHTLYYQWLAKCIELEYGDFLAEIGRALASALPMVSRLTSLTGSPGESGDSPPTPE